MPRNHGAARGPAAEADLSLDTVRFHIRNICEKLHVHSKSEAVLAALRTGILR